MKKYLIVILVFAFSIISVHLALICSDLVGIGGYDGIVSEAYLWEWRDKYGGSSVWNITEVLAMVLLVLGPIVMMGSFIYLVYLLIKQTVIWFT